VTGLTAPRPDPGIFDKYAVVWRMYFTADKAPDLTVPVELAGATMPLVSGRTVLPGEPLAARSPGSGLPPRLGLPGRLADQRFPSGAQPLGSSLGRPAGDQPAGCFDPLVGQSHTSPAMLQTDSNLPSKTRSRLLGHAQMTNRSTLRANASWLAVPGPVDAILRPVTS